ncbi:MAG: hypothetical protein ACJA0I_000782 [Gammaproteobacteria bacterium]|jgi:hypothetical protein
MLKKRLGDIVDIAIKDSCIGLLFPLETLLSIDILNSKKLLIICIYLI